MDEEHVSRSAFVSAGIALAAAAAAGVFGLHRPSDAEVAQLYDRRRTAGRAAEAPTLTPGERTPAALDDGALALEAAGRSHH